MELSPEIVEFLKYAAPRLEYIYGDNGMEKEAVNLVGLWNGARRAWNWGSNLFRGAKNVEQAAAVAGRAAGQAGRAGQAANTTINFGGQAANTATRTGQAANTTINFGGQAANTATRTGQAAPSVVVPLAPAAQATASAASQAGQAANAAGQAVGFGQRALAAAKAVGTQAAHYGTKALTNTFLPGWLAKYPMRWINNSRIGENAVRAATEMAGAKGVPAWMLKSTNMLGKGVAAATPWVAPAATLAYTTNKDTPADRMWMNNLFIPKMVMNKFMALPTLMWAANTDTGKQTVRSALHGVRDAGAWAMKHMPSVARPVAEGAQSLYNRLYDTRRDGSLRQMVSSLPWGPSIRQLEVGARGQAADLIASGAGINTDVMTPALEMAGRSLRKGKNLFNKMDQYEQIGKDLAASGLTQEKLERGVVALQQGQYNSEEAKALLDVLNKNIHNKNTVAGAYMNDSSTGGGKAMPYINAGIDAHNAGLTPQVSRDAWNALQEGNINSDSVKKFMTGADKLATDPNSFVGKVTADPNSVGGKLVENVKRQARDLRDAGVTSDVVQEAVQGAQGGNYNNAAAKQILTAANNVANDSNTAIGGYINDPNSLGGKYVKPALTVANDVNNVGLKPSLLRDAGRDLRGGNYNTETTRDVGNRLLNLVEGTDSAIGQRVQNSNLGTKVVLPAITAGREAVNAGVTLPQIVDAGRDIRGGQLNTDTTRNVGGRLLSMVEDPNSATGQRVQDSNLWRRFGQPTITAGREAVDAGVTLPQMVNAVRDVRGKNYNTDATRGVGGGLLNLLEDQNGVIGQNARKNKLVNNVVLPTITAGRELNAAGATPEVIADMVQDIRNRNVNSDAAKQVLSGVGETLMDQNKVLGQVAQKPMSKVRPFIDAGKELNNRGVTLPTLVGAGRDLWGRNLNTGNTRQLLRGIGNTLTDADTVVGQNARKTRLGSQVMPIIDSARNTDLTVLTPDTLRAAGRDLRAGNRNTENTRRVLSGVVGLGMNPKSAINQLARNPHISKRIAPTLNAVSEANNRGVTLPTLVGAGRDLWGRNLNTGNTRQLGKGLTMWALDPNSILGRNVRKNKVINTGLNTGEQLLRTGKEKVLPYVHRAEDFYDQMQQELQGHGSSITQMPLSGR